MLFVFPPLLVERCNMYESLLSILLSVATPCHYCFSRHALHVPAQVQKSRHRGRRILGPVSHTVHIAKETEHPFWTRLRFMMPKKEGERKPQMIIRVLFGVQVTNAHSTARGKARQTQFPENCTFRTWPMSKLTHPVSCVLIQEAMSW